ncbi:DUF3168 domain-containing protein [Mesorhizobium mediterraneum]|uniref:DUF3168 domain-containing protein n=1 Tax=Mesorhizobium mediterraneum TaxID=43617 RepID=A0AB36QZG0_9HYPH|nr:DUF3168 domain-containing protein [Mesorhizobium mediterraneum]PAP97814.1 hypothetical protein CIT25_35090 [Mesorhizobium mediterraneum]WIW52045.1 DUF3168 domain-containing protein [Mesorhizobium mediterraneum]
MSGAAIVRAILASDGTVTGLVGDRIYYTVAPQEAALPHLVILKGGLVEEIMLSGASGYPAERITIACHGSDFAAAETLGDAVIAATRDKTGTFAGKSATVWRDSVEASDYLPATRTERRLLGVVVRWR